MPHLNFWLKLYIIKLNPSEIHYWFVLEMWLIKKSSNLIGWEYSGSKTGTKIFSHMCRNTSNNINFLYRTNSVKTNDQIFQWIQNVFWPIFGPSFQFWGQNIFSRKSGFVTHNFTKFTKTNDTIPRKRPDRQKVGMMEGRTDPIS